MGKGEAGTEGRWPVRSLQESSIPKTANVGKAMRCRWRYKSYEAQSTDRYKYLTPRYTQTGRKRQARWSSHDTSPLAEWAALEKSRRHKRHLCRFSRNAIPGPATDARVRCEASPAQKPYLTMRLGHENIMSHSNALRLGQRKAPKTTNQANCIYRNRHWCSKGDTSLCPHACLHLRGVVS